MRDIWESYNLINFYMPKLHEQIKSKALPPLRLELLVTENEFKRQSIIDTLGALSYLVNKVNPRRTVINSASTFEDYLGELTNQVYIDYPQKLIHPKHDASISPDSQAEMGKLIQIIIESNDKKEILSRISEEKIRSIFYGNPVDFFIKDKAKLEFGDYFQKNHLAEMNGYREIVARRNLLAHNDGKVDRKYIREVPNPQFVIGQSITLSPSYIKKMIALLEGLAAAATVKVLEKIYKQSPQGHLKRSWDSFILYKPIP